MKKSQIGDVCSVEFLKNKKGIQPIARINGKVCFLKPDEIQKPKVGETWSVGIIKISETCMAISCLFIDFSIAETEKRKLDMLKTFKTNKPKKKKKLKIKHGYLSKNEQIQKAK